MQFPVPQFTDVEDKIIGSLTFKQFGIIFGVGIVVFLGYSLTKSLLVAIFLFLLLGLPALGLALVPFNGRPMYSFIGKLVSFFLSTKAMVFHKEASSLKSADNLKDVQLSAPRQETKTAADTQTRLQQVQEILNKTASQESEIIKKNYSN